MEINSNALLHIDISVTREIDVIPESSALTDRMVLDKDLLAMLVGLSLAFCELWSLALLMVETMSRHCWEVILTQTWVEMHNAAQPKLATTW